MIIINKNINDKAKPFLIGTDWWTDCDDAVAMRILSWASKKNLINILGISINACMEFSAVSLDAFLRKEGLPDINIGIDNQATDFGGYPPYQKNLANLPSKYRSNADCEDAVRLYRRILQNSSEKVDVIEIGYPQVLANLIKSKPDDLSELCGLDLIKQKVNKLWMMGGKWDDKEGGRENNFARNSCASEAAACICELWPTPITFLGWEVSNNILTGDNLKEDDVLFQILKDHGSSKGRSSWDPMLVLLAFINNEEKAGYSWVNGKASVEALTGINHFIPNENGSHRYVVKKFKDSYYKNQINNIILR